MLSLLRISRLAEVGDYERLLLEVIRNGRPLPLSLRVRLSQPESVAGAGLAMGLARLTELTWRPDAAAEALAGRLVALQERDGSWGAVGATALALGALLDFSRQARVCGVTLHGGLEGAVENAVERGLHHLKQVQDAGDAVGVEGLIGEAVDSAVVWARLEEHGEARGALRWADLEAALEESAADKDAAMVLAVSGRAAGAAWAAA